MTDKDINREKRARDAKWYVVHTYSGHENKVKANIENGRKSRNERRYIRNSCTYRRIYGY